MCVIYIDNIINKKLCEFRDRFFNQEPRKRIELTTFMTDFKNKLIKQFSSGNSGINLIN